MSKGLIYTASRGEIIEGAMWKAFNLACQRQGEVLLSFNNQSIMVRPDSRVNDLIKEYWLAATRTGDGRWQQGGSEQQAPEEPELPPVKKAFITPIIFKRQRVLREIDLADAMNVFYKKKPARKKKKVKKKKPVLHTGRKFDFD